MIRELRAILPAQHEHVGAAADPGQRGGGGPDRALQEGARPMRGYDSELAFGVVNLGDMAE